MANWHDMLKEAFMSTGDDFEKRICTLTKEEELLEFDDDYGRTNGKRFTAWGENWVYFPVGYDGMEWVDYAPRNPSDYSMLHVGEARR